MLIHPVLITAACIVGLFFRGHPAGCAIACMRCRGRDGLFLLVFATMMLPPHVPAIPI